MSRHEIEFRCRTTHWARALAAGLRFVLVMAKEPRPNATLLDGPVPLPDRGRARLAFRGRFTTPGGCRVCAGRARRALGGRRRAKGPLSSPTGRRADEASAGGRRPAPRPIDAARASRRTRPCGGRCGRGRPSRGTPRGRRRGRGPCPRGAWRALDGGVPSRPGSVGPRPGAAGGKASRCGCPPRRGTRAACRVGRRSGGAWSSLALGRWARGRPRRPPFGAHRGGVQARAAPVEPARAPQPAQGRLAQGLPRPCRLPVAKPSPAGDAAHTELLGHVPPRSIGPQHEEDPREARAVVRERVAALGAPLARRKQRLERAPKQTVDLSVGHRPSCDSEHGCETISKDV